MATFKKWFTAISQTNGIKLDDELRQRIKNDVMYDFAIKITTLFLENPILPRSLLMYTLFNKRFGFECEFYDEDNFEDGLEISTDEIVELCEKIFRAECELDIEKDDIRKFFGVGEFPFLKTKIMVDGEVVYYGYYITR